MATINQNISDEGIEFQHIENDHEFSISLSYGELRDREAITCDRCGAWLGSYRAMTKSMEEGLAQAAEIEDDSQRLQALEQLSYVLRRLRSAP